MGDWWWFSSRRMTVGVEVVGGIIRTTPPIVRKFRGQPLKNLWRWMSRQGGLRYERVARGSENRTQPEDPGS